MKVAIICEFSGVVRDAFLKLGYDAVSIDLLPSESLGPHIQSDARDVDYTDFGLLIAHPSCQFLAASGARWWAGRRVEQAEAIEFVQWILDIPVPMKCVENPVGCLPTHIGPWTQMIHPWQFGHGETKATCLWLQNLPRLRPTQIVDGRYPRVHRETRHPDRWKRRSRTYTGVAKAMAEQWGPLLEK